MYCRRYKNYCNLNNYDESMVQNTCKMCGTTADYYDSNTNTNNNILGINTNMNNDKNNSCACGFDHADSVFPENPVLAQSYVPTQKLNKTFVPCVGLKMGTIFPELVSPYVPCQSLEEIAFIKAMNTVKEGCNKC